MKKKNGWKSERVFDWERNRKIMVGWTCEMRSDPPTEGRRWKEDHTMQIWMEMMADGSVKWTWRQAEMDNTGLCAIWNRETRLINGERNVCRLEKFWYKSNIFLVFSEISVVKIHKILSHLMHSISYFSENLKIWNQDVYISKYNETKFRIQHKM